MADAHGSADLNVGEIFEGKYRILRELGRGGFGMVYLAYQEPMDRYVALKSLRPGIGLTAPSAKERFLREVRIISKLKHPNTVTIHDFGETAEGGLYMTLEYVEGEELKQILRREGPQDPLRAAEIGRQIARSLSEAHQHGVVHRDLKPANIMITNMAGEKDFVKVLDFGVARLLDPKTSDLTSVGLPDGERELIGTPRYMSPEQVRGESLTGASDIYSLGLILYEIATGEPAVQGETTMGLITQQISPEPLALPLLHGVEPGIADIIRISVAKPVQDRFRTADQVAEALDHYIMMVRRQRNMTGSQSNEMLMSSYQSQLTNMHPPSVPDPNYATGWQQPQPGWPPQSGQWPAQQPPPGQWGYPDQAQFPAPDPYQSGRQNAYQTMPPGQANQTPSGNFAYPHGAPTGGHEPVYTGHNNPYATGGHAPVPGVPVNDASGQNPAFQRNDHFEDLQATVERSSLDRSALGPRSSFAGMEAPSFSELPPPPMDERPFVPEPEPEPEHHKPEPELPPHRPRQAVTRKDDDLMAFSLSVIKVLLLSCLALVSAYLLFLVLGAAVGKYVEGTLRLLACVVTVVLIPLVVAMSESGPKERFRVVEANIDRAVRILTGASVFLIAGAFIISTFAVNNVVRELRTSPNWFLTNGSSTEGLPELNRKASFAIADLVGGAMSALGIYNDRPAPSKPNIPLPTRNTGKTKASADADSAVEDSVAAPGTEEDKIEPVQRRQDEGSSGKKGDYVKW